jgi:CheY-like chemotaxis protein
VTSAKPLRVLLVEDSEADAQLVLRQLRKNGYEPSFTRVETADDMRRLLDGDPWDVVIADYSLPQFNAVAALAILHDKGLDIPFIIHSGTIGEDIAV